LSPKDAVVAVDCGVLEKSSEGAVLAIVMEDGGLIEDFESCLFLKLLELSAPLELLSLRAGIATALLSARSYLLSSGGDFALAFCSSSITAWRIDDIDAAG
jgi:hypothetical protein